MNGITHIATAVNSVSMDHTLVYLSYAIIALVLFKDPLVMLGAKLFRIKTTKDKEDLLREDLKDHEAACLEVNKQVLQSINGVRNDVSDVRDDVSGVRESVARIEGKLDV